MEGEIIERNFLSNFTNNFITEKNGDENLQIEDYMKINEKIRVFCSQDIKIKSGMLRNSQKLPLEFSFGILHKKTPITLRRTLPHIYNIEYLPSEFANKKDFETLS